MRNIVAGIDIGTSKVCTTIGYINDQQELVILGEGLSFTSGLKKGRITDVGEIASAIKDSAVRAEKKANAKFISASVNIIGMNVEMIKRQISVEIENSMGSVKADDVYRILSLAKDIEIPEDKIIIEIILKNYKIDDRQEVSNPIGMSAKKLELTADLILADRKTYQDIESCMTKAGIEFDGFVLGALAEGAIILTSVEKNNGVLMIDTGAGITDISVIKNNSLMFYNSIPVGGENITNDLSIVLKTSYNDAEKIKKQYELAKASLIQNDHEVRLSGQDLFSQRNVMVSEIVEVIEARVNEIFTMAKEAIAESGTELEGIQSIVLSGEGISLFHGASEIAEEVFGIKVRVSAKKINGTLNPIFNTSAGIVKYVSDLTRNTSSEILTMKGHRVKRKQSVWKKIKGIFN